MSRFSLLWPLLGVALLTVGCQPRGSAEYVPPREVVTPGDLPKTDAERDRAANPFAPLVVEFALGDGQIEGAVSTTESPVRTAFLEFEVFDKTGGTLGRFETTLSNVTRDDPVVFSLRVPPGTASAKPITLKSRG